MIHTIRWMVAREPQPVRSRMSFVTLSWFLFGGLVGGTIAGVLVATLARGLFLLVDAGMAPFAASAAVVSLVALGQRLRLWTIPFPQFRHQVPEAWRNTFSTRAGAFLYAGALGLAFFTKVTSLVFYPLVLLSLGLGAAPFAIVAIFAIQGLARASTGVFVLLRPKWLSMEGDLVVSELNRWIGWVRLAEIAVLGSATAWLVFFVAARV